MVVELKRLLNRKNLVLLAVFFLGNLVLFYYEQQKEIEDFNGMRKDYARLVEEYRDSSVADARARLTDLMRQIRAGESTVNYDAARILSRKLQYLEGYTADINQVFVSAEKIKRLSFFAKPDSYAYNNTLKTAKDFEILRNLSPTLDNDRAVERIVAYPFMNYWVIAFMVVVLYTMFCQRRADVWPLVHTAKEGRGGLAFWQLLWVNAVLLITVILLYGSTVLLSLGLYGGFGDLGNPVQTVEACGNVCRLMSKGGYLLLMAGADFMMLATVTSVIWLIMQHMKNRNQAIFVLAVFVGAEFILYQRFDTNSVYAMLHHINIINLFDMHRIVSTYRNWGIGTFVVSLSATVVAVCFCLWMMISALIWLGGRMQRPMAKKGILSKAAERVSVAFYKVMYRFPVFVLEVHKLLFTRKGIVIMAIVLLASWYFIDAGMVEFAESDKENDLLCLEKGGKDYSQLEQIVGELTKKVQESSEYCNKIQADYEKGLAQERDVTAAALRLYGYTLELSRYSTVSQRMEHIYQLKAERGIEGYLMPENGYLVLFGALGSSRRFTVELILLVGIVVIVIESFSYEHASGMKYLLHACSGGHTRFFMRKAGAAALIATIMAGLAYLLEIETVSQRYGLPFLEAPIQSLTFMGEVSWQICIWQYLLLQYVLLLVCVYTAMCAALFVSVFTDGKGTGMGVCIALPAVVAGWIAVHGLSVENFCMAGIVAVPVSAGLTLAALRKHILH